MLFDCHMHTPLCGHALGQPLDYMRAAAERSIDLITFTCHIPMGCESFGGRGIRMREADLEEYLAIISETRTKGEKLGVEVLTGIEAEIFPDESELELMDRVLKNHDFDFILGSLHHQVAAYRKLIDSLGLKRDEDIIAHYFDTLAGGAETGRYHSLSHPDVIRLYGTLRGTFDPAANEAIIKSALDRIAATGICMEVNTSGCTKGDYVVHPDPLLMDWIRERNIPLTIGSDSHTPQSVGQYFDENLSLLSQKGFSHLHYFRKGQRHAVPIEDMMLTAPV
jgi:histidinol-phosphatase (PHP family)